MRSVVDHVALEVDDLDSTIERLVRSCGLEVLREGKRHGTGQRIAMLGDGTGFKLELIEGVDSPPKFAHLAVRVPDVEGAHDEFLSEGWKSLTPPHDLPAAMARTALLADGGGLAIQIVAYQPGSPDMRCWADENPPPGPTTPGAANQRRSS